MVLAFLGAVLSTRDSARQKEYEEENGQESDDTSQPLFGNLLALGSAFSGVGYLVTASKCRPSMNIYVFLFNVMVITALLSLCCIYATGTEVSWDRDTYHGVFGWTNFRKNRLPLEVVMVLSCNFIGSMGKNGVISIRTHRAFRYCILNKHAS